MTDLLLKNDQGDSLYTNVLYAEVSTRARDSTNGVSIQYKDGDTEFVPHAQILGFHTEGYPDD
jgi:hypothetical protein